MADVWKRYIFIREDLQFELMNQISELYGKERILGVHARGSDFKQGVLNHPNAVPMEEYFKNIDELEQAIHGYIRYYNEVCLKRRLKNLSSVQDRAQCYLPQVNSPFKIWEKSCS